MCIDKQIWGQWFQITISGNQPMVKYMVKLYEIQESAIEIRSTPITL